MAQGLVLWTPNHCQIKISHSLCFHRRRRREATSSTNRTPLLSISATLEPATQSQSQSQSELSGRERRKLKNERRESKLGSSWREEVEMRLLKKPKKRYATWKEELNLDKLAELGPQWWVLRVSRATGHYTAELLARSLVRNFPDFPFKVYAPSVKVKRKLKNGTISIKPKPLFPGCVFLKCVLNKEMHDFLKECDGVRSFVGSMVGNITIRQINKPKPVDEVDMEAIFKRAKEEQEKHEKEFEEEQKQAEILKAEEPQLDVDSKQAKKSAKKGTKLVTGSTVRVLSGDFAEFEGSVIKINRKTKKATVGFTLLGKKSLVELDLNEIVAETE